MIILVLILGLIIRAFSLNQSFWLDEATSALTTKMSLVDFLGKFMPGDFHPPLYYIILRVWSLIFGSSEIALRSLSIVFGISTIYIVYLIGKELVNKKTGLIAGLLLATSGLFVYYSQEARMYTMASFLVCLLVFSFVKILKEKGRLGDWLVFILVLPAIFLTDYLAVLIFVPIWIYLILERKNILTIKKFITSHIILGISILVWIPVFLRQLSSGLKVTNGSPAWVNVLGKFSIKDVLLIPIKFMI